MSPLAERRNSHSPDPTQSSDHTAAELQSLLAARPIESGRLFFRNHTGGQAGFVGLVEVPESLPVEQIARLILVPSHLGMGHPPTLLLDTFHKVDLKERMHWHSQIPECDIGYLLTGLQWASFKSLGSSVQGNSVSAFEAFVRAPIDDAEQPVLAPSQPGLRWVIVAGGLKAPLKAFPEGGLVEISSDGLRLIDSKPYKGMTTGMVLHKPIWGPGGQFGLRASMEPKHFPAFMEKNQRENAAKDKSFGEFLKEMALHPSPPMVYTAAQQREYSDLCTQVAGSLMARESARQEAEYALAQAARDSTGASSGSSKAERTKAPGSP